MYLIHVTSSLEREIIILEKSVEKSVQTLI